MGCGSTNDVRLDACGCVGMLVHAWQEVVRTDVAPYSPFDTIYLISILLKLLGECWDNGCIRFARWYCFNVVQTKARVADVNGYP